MLPPQDIPPVSLNSSANFLKSMSSLLCLTYIVEGRVDGDKKEESRGREE